MRPQSDKKLATEEASKSREFLSSLATAETARTASHIIIAGNAMLSSSASPLLSSSLNSIFSSVATAITYGRTPQKIQQARLKDLKTLLENSRPLFALEMQTFFAESTSYQKLKKQFEALDQKYFAALESKPNTFRYLIFLIGLVGSLYFIVRLFQDSEGLNGIETISVLGMMLMMSYSNVHSHRDLVMCSRKDYEEFVDTLIQFNTQAMDEVPILKAMITLEKTKLEIKDCIKQLNELVTDESAEGSAEERKGDEVALLAGREENLMPRVKGKLHYLVNERNQRVREIQQQKDDDLRNETSSEIIVKIEQATERRKQTAQNKYQKKAGPILSLLEKLTTLQTKHDKASEEIQEFYEVLRYPELLGIHQDEIRAFREEFPAALFEEVSVQQEEEASIGFPVT